ncbi:MAG TPA: DNA-binding domain-containing protein [Kofleriaceae bacterium]|nr:DNA-binding domain-containing protein [Kofleriaceae bacterium]
MRELLRRFHDAIVGDAPLSSACELVRTDGIDPLARLHAYAHAYRARIASVLADDYPKLRVLLGGAAFDALVVPYLRAYPTRHWSLREAGAYLAEYLVELPPAAELARLERARVEAFDGADAAAATRDDLSELAPEAFPALRFALVPTATFVDLATNVDELWDAIESERALPPLVESPRTVLVWRRDTTVIHRTLDADEPAALAKLAAGARFGELCEALTAERAVELLVRWLDAGILVRPAVRAGAVATPGGEAGAASRRSSARARARSSRPRRAGRARRTRARSAPASRGSRARRCGSRGDRPRS